MKKILFILFILLAIPAAALADKVSYFHCDFESGLPQGTTLRDADGQTLHFTMTQAGFDQGDSWKIMSHGGNAYLTSPGRYKKQADKELQPADKWVVFPELSVLADDATLTWRANTISETLTQGGSYEVYADDELLTTVTSESLNKWTEHELSLGKYVGKKLKIAFRCTSFNSEILAIDDVNVKGGSGRYLLTSTTPTLHYGDELMKMSCSLKSTSDRTITALKAYCDLPEVTLTKEFIGLSLSDGQELEIVFDEPQQLFPGEVLKYGFRVEIEGEHIEQPMVEGQILSLLFKTHRRTVVEEGTGMWCGYCPKGIVAMHTLREKYPDDFIGIAVHWDDVLGGTPNLQNYGRTLAFPSFPSAWVNRVQMNDEMMVQRKDGTFTALEGGLESSFLEEQAVVAPADMKITWIKDGDKLKATISTVFAVNLSEADFRLTAVMVEDEVSAPTYYQTNYYSGYDYPLGGFEDMAKTIKPYTFHEVARGELLPTSGITAKFEPLIYAGKDYSYSFACTMPAYNNINNVRVVAMLIDGHSGTIMNACQSYIDEAQGIMLNVSDDVNDDIAFDLAGRAVSHSATRGLTIINCKKVIK